MKIGYIIKIFNLQTLLLQIYYIIKIVTKINCNIKLFKNFLLEFDYEDGLNNKIRTLRVCRHMFSISGFGL